MDLVTGGNDGWGYTENSFMFPYRYKLDMFVVINDDLCELVDRY